MKKYRFLALLLLLPMVAGLFAPPAAALDDPTVYCNNAVLYDANYGEVLYDLDAYERAYPASTTKVMTALLVVEAIAACWPPTPRSPPGRSGWRASPPARAMWWPT